MRVSLLINSIYLALFFSIFFPKIFGLSEEEGEERRMLAEEEEEDMGFFACVPRAPRRGGESGARCRFVVVASFLAHRSARASTGRVALSTGWGGGSAAETTTPPQSQPHYS